MQLKHFFSDARSCLQSFRTAAFSWRTLISAAGILIIMVLFALVITPVRYNISVGMVPTHTITANRDVVDEVTTEALRTAAEQAVQPSYITVEGIAEQVLQHMDQIYAQMNSVIQYSETLDDYSPTRRYSAEELEYARSILTSLNLRDYQMRTLLNTSRSDLSTMYSLLYDSVQNALDSYIIQGSEYVAVSSIMQIIGYRVDASLLQNVVQPLLDEVIEPNVVIDQEATEAARRQARENVEPVIYKQGQNIVVKGEGRVEKYQYEMLSSMGLLSNTTINFAIYLGGMLFVGLTLSTALVLLRLLCKEIIFDAKRLILLFIILIITLICCIVMRLLNIYLAPIVLAALLITSMLDIRPGIIFNAATGLLVSALAAGGSTSYTSEMVLLIASSLCSGTIGAALVNRKANRLRTVASGAAAGLCSMVIILSLGLMTSNSIDTVLKTSLWGLASGAISGILCVALQPLLELLFNLPTPMKLLELSNPNHPLLRRLLLEAPGTYHHSIVVSNLAEAAAEAIGANPLLARVGGYYHDIGKLRRPQYFKENQMGNENKLTENDPYTAAQIVISHTRDGVLLAHNYHLPREIIRIIHDHHGNAPVMYFYTMAVNAANGGPVDAAAFRYDADPPSSKECAIVMLCDTIEAAVRSMQNPTPEAIEDFIVKLVRGKLQDGQLSNSPLTLKDIDDICHACATVLNGVFHERIEYPDPPAHMPPPTETAADDPASSSKETDLTKPWDGISAPAEDSSPTVSDSGHIPPTADGLLNKPQQIKIDPEEFDPDQTLPEIPVPQVEQIPSVDDMLKSMDNDQSSDPSGNTDSPIK